MLKLITPAQAEEMRATIRQRSDSYLEFALQVAVKVGDAMAIDIYDAEMERREVETILAMTPVLDAIPTWDQVNPGI